MGQLSSGEAVGLRSKVRAQNIDGNDIWYLLRDRPGWVAARYMKNTGDVQWAGGATVSVGADADTAG
ncbi:hypothetical protein ACFWIB_38455 [Streptomyces sp. NPDC127051]|uniref:hypothetical protein n=1 Tax=Streptomyces sp. NPDC127051 TaxID=3347119 RepID=UPI0036515E45